MTGWRLEAHRRHRLGAQLAAQVRHGPLDRAQATANAVLALQILAHDVGVATVLREAARQASLQTLQS